MSHAAGAQARLLLIDDDAEICRSVQRFLAPHGFAVDSASSADAGMRQASSNDYALVLLNIYSRACGGLEMLRRIRAQSKVPIVILTSRPADTNAIAALELGADDALAKPFNPRELLARVHAVLRRATKSPALHAGPLVMADLELDAGARRVRVCGRRIELTSMEFDVLNMLLRSAGRTVTRDELYRALLGRQIMSDDRSIDMHVSHLRRKLGPAPYGAARIKTVRGVGYEFPLPPQPSRRYA